MERPLKLMKAAVSQPLQICNENRKCSFIDLPDNVVLHIFSFLSLRNLFRFIHASKRIKELYLTNPFLTFDGIELARNYGARSWYLNLLDRLLVEREGSKISSFRIHWGFPCRYMEAYRVNTWLNVAVECNVEVLDLELCCDESEKINLPLCLFRCVSLKSMAVDLHGGFLALPSSLGFGSLQSLSLTFVKMANNFDEWISTFCECLKELRLENIEGRCNVSIKSSSLLRFTLVESRLSSQLRHLRVAGGKLEVVDLLWRFNSSAGKSLKISAPSLKYLKWSGNPTNDNCLDLFLQLKGAQLFLEPKKDTDNNLHKILIDVIRAEEISFQDVMIKALHEQEYPCPCLNYVRGLCIYISSLSNDLVPAMISLLIGMPNLKTLKIKSSALLADTNASERVRCSIKDCSLATKFFDKFFASENVHCKKKSSTPSANNNASGFDARYWESQNLRFIYGLEMVEIELFDGFNALGLALFLLKHAKKLKKMVVFHSSLPSDNFMKIQNRSMNSAATVVFREK